MKITNSKINECVTFSVFLFILLAFYTKSFAQAPRFRVLAIYSNHVESDHVQFARKAIEFFGELTSGEGFILDTSSNIDDLNPEKLQHYQLILMLNDFPHSAKQRASFEDYMKNGGGWMGFHVAAYNDKTTQWPWFVDFLGGAVFYSNNWPPQPAKLQIDNTKHTITKELPQHYIAPTNEWYQWQPSPRERKNIQVLASLSKDNYPLGLKDILHGGDTPVVWTNTDYRMIYLNMGHSPATFSDATQNMLIVESLRWVIASDKRGNVFQNPQHEQ